MKVVADAAAVAAEGPNVDALSAACVAGAVYLIGEEGGKKPASAQKLNAKVDIITAQKTAEAKKNGMKLAREFVAATRPMTWKTSGLPVYNDDRLYFLPLVFLTAALLFMGSCVLRYGVAVLFITFLISFVFYDLYSGILHLCLDHPDNIDVPVLGQPCLEFQWHHHIPDDIVTKGIFEACADLNLVATLLSSIHFCFTSNWGEDKLALGGLACKIMLAYFGQYSHRSAHNRLGDRSALAMWLQRNGLMISVADHHKHHTMPHDTEFCLIGVCNPLMNRFIKYVPAYENPRLYLTLFAIWSFADIPAVCGIVRMLVPAAAL